MGSWGYGLGFRVEGLGSWDQENPPGYLARGYLLALYFIPQNIPNHAKQLYEQSKTYQQRSTTCLQLPVRLHNKTAKYSTSTPRNTSRSSQNTKRCLEHAEANSTRPKQHNNTKIPNEQTKIPTHATIRSNPTQIRSMLPRPAPE